MGVRSVCEYGFPVSICRCAKKHDPVDVVTCPDRHRHDGLYTGSGPGAAALDSIVDQVHAAMDWESETDQSEDPTAWTELGKDAEWGVELDGVVETFERKNDARVYMVNLNEELFDRAHLVRRRVQKRVSAWEQVL